MAFVSPGMAVIAGLLAQHSVALPWLADLATHWVFPSAVVFGVSALFGPWRGRLVSVGGLALCLLLAGELALPKPQDGRGARALSVVSANVLSTNTSTAEFLEVLSQAQPDLVAVQEVSPRWAALLRAQVGYPYQRMFPREDNFGIALLSRHPFEVEALLDFDDVPSIVVTVDVPGGAPVRVVVTHPVPPVNASAHASRDQQLGRMGALLAGYPGPAILVGDLNATVFSSPLQRLRREGLSFATGLRPTWPSAPWFSGVVTLDHVVVNDRVLGARATVGPHIGSDHRPVIAHIQLP